MSRNKCQIFNKTITHQIGTTFINQLSYYLFINLFYLKDNLYHSWFFYFSKLLHFTLWQSTQHSYWYEYFNVNKFFQDLNNQFYLFFMMDDWPHKLKWLTPQITKIFQPTYLINFPFNLNGQPNLLVAVLLRTDLSLYFLYVPPFSQPTST